MNKLRQRDKRTRASCILEYFWKICFERFIGIESISPKKRNTEEPNRLTNRYDEEETSSICFYVYNYRINLFHPQK